jgi:hypothetical protein
VHRQVVDGNGDIEGGGRGQSRDQEEKRQGALRPHIRANHRLPLRSNSEIWIVLSVDYPELPAHLPDAIAMSIRMDMPVRMPSRSRRRSSFTLLTPL